MQTYRFAGMQVTHQAFLILLAGSTLSALMLIGSLFLPGSAKVAGMVLSLVIFGITCYSGYVTNCTVVGKCHKLAWFLVAMQFLVLVAYGFQFWNMFSTGRPMSQMGVPMSPLSSRSPRRSRR